MASYCRLRDFRGDRSDGFAYLFFRAPFHFRGCVPNLVFVAYGA